MVLFYQLQRGGVLEVRTFFQSIILKGNVLARIGFELAYNNVGVQYAYYAMRTYSFIKMLC